MSKVTVNVLLFAGIDMEDDFHNIMDDMEYKNTQSRNVTVVEGEYEHDGVVISCEMDSRMEDEFEDKAQRRMEDSMGIDFVYGNAPNTIIV